MALALCLWAAAASPALAQILADPSAPANQRPTVLTDGEGRPLVNIQSPSRAGVSRNTYRQFDVGANGAVLNNSRASNPWLARGEAKVILNEVNSSNPSHLRGTITVNGATAQVIVANPKGLVVDGAGFVNASRAVLTTGTANLQGGALTGITVQEGTVRVQGQGLNNDATPYTDILSRAATIVAPVHGREVNVVTGAQTMDWNSGALTASAAKGAKPTLAIDTSALGGMYANSIHLLATESGVGVRNQGTLRASGQLTVTADGQLQNQGTMQADVTRLGTTTGHHIENSGQLQAQNALLVVSGGDARFIGDGASQTAGSKVVVSAKGSVHLLDRAGQAPARLQSNANGGRVNIHADKDIHLQARSQIGAHGDIRLNAAGQLHANQATVNSGQGEALLLAGKNMNIRNSTVTGARAHLETGEPFKNGEAALSITGGQIKGRQQTAVLASGTVTIHSPGSAAVSGDGHVHVQGNTVHVAAGSQISAKRHMTVVATHEVDLKAAPGRAVALSAGGNLQVSGGSVTASGSQINAGQALTIEATRAHLELHATPGAAGKDMQSVRLVSGADLNLAAHQGSIHASGLQAVGKNVNIVSNGQTIVAHATEKSGSVTKITGNHIRASEDITLASVLRQTGAPSQVQVTATDLKAGGHVRLLSHGNVHLNSALGAANGTNVYTHTNVHGGRITVQGGQVTVSAAHLLAHHQPKKPGPSSGDIQITSTASSVQLSPRAGRLSRLTAAGHVHVHAQGDLHHGATEINASGSHSSTSKTGKIHSNDLRVWAGDIISLASQGAQTHTGANLLGGAISIHNKTGDLHLLNVTAQANGTQTQALAAVSGQTSVESGGALTLGAGTTLKAATDLSLVMGRGDIVVAPYRVSRGGFLRQRSRWINRTVDLKQLSAGRDLTLATRNGSFIAIGNAFNDPANVLSAPRNLNVMASRIQLKGTTLRAGRTLNLTATGGNIKIEGLDSIRVEGGFANHYWQAATLNARDINLKAATDIELSSVQARASNRLDMQAGRNLTVSGNHHRWQVDQRPTGGWYKDEQRIAGSLLSGHNGVSLKALGGHLILNATDVHAANGRAELQAGGHLILEAAETGYLHQRSHTRVKKGWLGLNKTTITTHYHNEAVRARPVTIRARDIILKAGNDVRTYASQLHAAQRLHVTAGDRVLYHAVEAKQINHVSRHKTSRFIGIKYNSSKSNNS
ncbi:MAG: filamentous hemagglutinin N-terminal domain-containing protein, partial [Pseudomonadota bacterium]|nr:filamentous hemagglutinin N-terminal domain-containing protein [Pseudomonadota bacterium]